MQPVSFSGGGDVVNGVAPAMSVTPGTAVSGLWALAAGEVVILKKAGIQASNGSIVSTSGIIAATNRGIYSLQGKLIGNHDEAQRSACAHPGVYVVEMGSSVNHCSARRVCMLGTDIRR